MADAHDAEAPTVNQRNALKWEVDEALGLGATISAVLYANTNHPELKRDFSRKPLFYSSAPIGLLLHLLPHLLLLLLLPDSSSSSS